MCWGEVPPGDHNRHSHQHDLTVGTVGTAAAVAGMPTKVMLNPKRYIARQRCAITSTTPPEIKAQYNQHPFSYTSPARKITKGDTHHSDHNHNHMAALRGCCPQHQRSEDTHEDQSSQSLLL